MNYNTTFYKYIYIYIYVKSETNEKLSIASIKIQENTNDKSINTEVFCKERAVKAHMAKKNLQGFFIVK